MSDRPDSASFFRKVVKFVANPATDWADLNAPLEETREAEYAKSELKAMIDRKRRNDFVRKREFDMLRKVRREGLTSEQLAALGGSSRLDDSDGRINESGAKPDSGVKAKIDEIEQQMVGNNYAPAAPAVRRPSGNFQAPPAPFSLENATTIAAVLTPATGARALDSAPLPLPLRNIDIAISNDRAAAASGRAVGIGSGNTSNGVGGTTAPGAVAGTRPGGTNFGYGGHAMNTGLAPLDLDSSNAEFGSPLAVEVSEVAHDPDLDEAVIAFANADFDLCEQSLLTLTGHGGLRAQHAETWLVLFDLYRATGQQHKFESLAMDYVQQFGWSSPQWFSMPQMVAEAARHERPTRVRYEGRTGWTCPEVLDIEAITKLQSQALHMPLPWVLDFTDLRSIDPEACAKLGEAVRNWAGQPLDMRWINGEKLFTVLQESAPTGDNDIDPSYWLLRLDVLRLANRADQFDETAMDYCITYEVSPPSWERPRCHVRISGAGQNSTAPPMSVGSGLSTGFVESQLFEDASGGQTATVELSGQLVGDIGETLTKLQGELGTAPVITISCSRLIRVDFIAAGDLLNWVLARRAENRNVTFDEAQRLVALFFGAMGINEHARVKVRPV
ncbi:hypothetical protein BH09PSE5_BH09PSE5_18620 [soil metagenome]